MSSSSFQKSEHAFQLRSAECSQSKGKKNLEHSFGIASRLANFFTWSVILVFESPVRSGFLMLRGLNCNHNWSFFSQKPKRPQTMVFCGL
ncbi:hypothetical protein K443DRAFT_113416 [Laccaria amethystina LaAM-08-1]|uniref:Uncharacterized protein n=1 Tax=Laccaria amethystina LaAM-08-1 TaxID=1095629 RepID=A0A0C9X887_9AGAR|nr:hypothetical protein K443DRAFT_113416 [Laccaria amethystina LaAM-08-1]